MISLSLNGKMLTLQKNTSDSVVFCPLGVTYYQMLIYSTKKMKDLESEFERLVREHRGTIYTVCYMFSNDQDEVADLFQEVRLNVCISLDHKKRRHKTVPLTMDINPYEETETNQNSRQMDMLRQRIAKLGQYDRAIILLWLENMSYEEIGAIMGISVKNVSVRLYRIKEELKKMMVSTNHLSND